MITQEKAGEIVEDMKELCDEINALNLPPLTEEEKIINDQMFEEWSLMLDAEYDSDYKLRCIAKNIDLLFEKVPNTIPELSGLAWKFAHLMESGIDLRHYLFRNNDVLVKSLLSECSWDFLDDWRIIGHIKDYYSLKEIKRFRKIVERYQDSEAERTAIKALIEIFKKFGLKYAMNAKKYAREWVKEAAPYLPNNTASVKSAFEERYGITFEKSYHGCWAEFTRAMNSLGFVLGKNK